MIGLYTEKIQLNGKDEKLHSKIHEAPGIDPRAGGFVFETRVFTRRKRSRDRAKDRGGNGEAAEEVSSLEAAASCLSA